MILILNMNIVSKYDIEFQTESDSGVNQKKSKIDSTLSREYYKLTSNYKYDG